MAKGAPPPFAKKGAKPNPFAGKKAPPFGGGGGGGGKAAAPPFFKRGGKVGRK